MPYYSARTSASEVISHYDKTSRAWRGKEKKRVLTMRRDLLAGTLTASFVLRHLNVLRVAVLLGLVP